MSNSPTNNIVVFGGSSGVGLATAKLALTHLPNANIIITSSNPAKLSTALSQLQDLASAHPHPTRILASIPADLADSSQHFDRIESVLQFAVENFHAPINHIIWTAGDFPNDALARGGLAGRSNEDLLAILSTRVFGPMTLGALAKKFMAADDRRSSITLTTGTSAFYPRPGRGRLAAMASGIEGAVKGLAVDLAPLRVNGVVLGAVHTPLLERLAPRGSEMVDVLANGALVGAVAEAEEAAEAYLYSMRCAFVDGAMIWCDGGAGLKRG